MANSDAVIFGTALLYSTPHGEKNAFPEDTVNYGGDWGTPTDQEAAWEARGYTNDGIGLSMSVDREEINADQVLDPLFRPITGRDITISTTLIEMTADNLNLGLGQGAVTTTAPGAGTRGYDQWDVTANVTDQYNSWGIDVEKPADGEPIRGIVWKGLSTGSLDTTFGNRSAAAGIPIEITALPDDTGETTRIFTLRDYVAALPEA